MYVKIYNWVKILFFILKSSDKLFQFPPKIIVKSGNILFRAVNKHTVMLCDVSPPSSFILTENHYKQRCLVQGLSSCYNMFLCFFYVSHLHLYMFTILYRICFHSFYILLSLYRRGWDLWINYKSRFNYLYNTHISIWFLREIIQFIQNPNNNKVSCQVEFISIDQNLEDQSEYIK